MIDRALAAILLVCAAAAPVSVRAENDPVNMRDIGPVEAVEAPSDAAEAELPMPPPRPGRSTALRGEGSPDIRALIARHAAVHGVPAAFADAVARVESRYNPRAANRGNFGLMQIRLQTARGEGYTGSALGLLDAETNAHFGIKHLARAWRLANGDACGAVMRYQSGLRATRMSGANRAYCAKVKTIMGAASASL